MLDLLKKMFLQLRIAETHVNGLITGTLWAARQL
jgi:hypothetical protein